MLHSTQVNPIDWRGDEAPTAVPAWPKLGPATPDPAMDRAQALAALNSAMRTLAGSSEHASLVRSLDAAYAYFDQATAESEVRGVVFWNAALRAADIQIRTMTLPRAGWSADAQSSACACALAVRNLVIDSTFMTPEQQTREVEARVDPGAFR